MTCKIIYLILALAIGIQAQAEEVHVITFDYPPYMIENPRDDLRGIDNEITEFLISQDHGDVTYRYLPMRRAVLEMKQTVPATAIHIGTSVHFAFEIKEGLFKSIKIGSGKFVTYINEKSRRGLSKVNKVEDLAGVKVAVLRGSAIVPILRDAKLDVLEVGTFKQLFRVLEHNRVDAAIVLELSGDYYLSKEQVSLPNLKILKLPGILMEISTEIIIPLHHPMGKELLARMLSRRSLIKQSGRLKGILEKYGLDKNVISSFIADW